MPADVERLIRDKIIEKLNLDASTREPGAVRKWYRSEPAAGRPLPFGYVQFNRRVAVPERGDHTAHTYELEYEVGVVQKVSRAREDEADDFVTDLLARVETVLLRNLSLDGLVESLSLPREKEIIRGSTRELGDVSWGRLLHRVRKSLDARL